MMEHELQQTMSLLARTPAALNGLLRDLPEAWILGDEGENTWSPFDIVVHLIHAEHTDWMPRARMICNSVRAGRLNRSIVWDRCERVEVGR